MKLILTGLIIIIMAGCGWSKQCGSYRSYNLNEEKSVNVGSAFVQDGCFSEREDPRPIWRALGRKSHFHDNFRPQVDSEMLYSGREGKILHVTYREYTYEGLARSAFFQQLYYDTSMSDSIVFKDWEIKVLDSNNEHIRFKVIKEPLRPEIPPPTL